MNTTTPSHGVDNSPPRSRPSYSAAYLRRRPLVVVHLRDGQPERVEDASESERAAVARNLSHRPQRIVRFGDWPYLITDAGAATRTAMGFALPKGCR